MPATTNVNVPTGTHTVNVTGINTATTITTNGSGGAVNVGSTAPTLGGTVASIAALLTVNGASGDSLAIDDSGSVTSTNLVSVTNSAVTVRSTHVSYSGPINLSLDVGSGGDTILVAGTSTASTTIIDAGGNDTYNVTGDAGTTTIMAGNGNDTFNVQGTGAGGLTGITTGAGTDTVNLGSNAPGSGGIMSALAGAVSVTGPVSSTHTKLDLDDTGNSSPATFNVNGTTITGTGGVVSYSHVSALAVNLGSGGNAVTISGTSAPTTVGSGSGNDTVAITGVAAATVLNTGLGNDAINVQAIGAATTINPGSGSDTVTVGAATHTLAGIGAALTVNGQASTTLAINDSANSTASSGVLATGTVSGLDLAVGGSIVYSGVGAVGVSLGSGTTSFTVTGTNAATDTITSKSGHDTIAVQATAGGTTTNLVDSALTSSDAFNVGTGKLNLLQGAVTVQGIANDALTLSDASDVSNASGTVSASAVTGFGMAGAGSDSAAFRRSRSISPITIPWPSRAQVPRPRRISIRRAGPITSIFKRLAGRPISTPAPEPTTRSTLAVSPHPVPAWSVQ